MLYLTNVAGVLKKVWWLLKKPPDTLYTVIMSNAANIKAGSLLITEYYGFVSGLGNILHQNKSLGFQDLDSECLFLFQKNKICRVLSEFF